MLITILSVKIKILHNIKFLDEIPKYEPFINAQEKMVYNT